MKSYVMNKWIPVTKELPYDNETVLITTNSGLVQIGYLYRDYWYSIVGIIGANLIPINVKAWMRLPDAYREES